MAYSSVPDCPPQLETKYPLRVNRGLERARLMISLACVDKYGLGFLCGGIIALRDLKLMRHVRVWSASGQGVLLQAWLQLLCLEHGWDVLSSTPRDRADPLQQLVDWVIEWCVTEHEKELFRARICRYLSQLVSTAPQLTSGASGASVWIPGARSWLHTSRITMSSTPAGRKRFARRESRSSIPIPCGCTPQTSSTLARPKLFTSPRTREAWTSPTWLFAPWARTQWATSGLGFSRPVSGDLI